MLTQPSHVPVLAFLVVALATLSQTACGDAEVGDGAAAADVGAGDTTGDAGSDPADDDVEAPEVPDDRGDATAPDADVGDVDVSGSDDASDAPESDGEVGDIADADGDADATEPDADSSAATTCPDGEELRFGADLPATGLALPGTFGTCADAAHPLVAGVGSRWTIEATEVPDGTVVWVYPARFFSDRAAGIETLALGTGLGARSGIARTTFDASTSGEFVVVLDRAPSAATAPYRVSAQCRERCTVEATRYPIVLLHGYAGVDSYFGILDYFHDVLPTLNRAGYVAYTPVVSPIATSERRVSELAPQLEAILAETGARKLNLVAHSQGGTDARLLVSGAGWGDRIASVTTIATPHRGIPLLLADFLSIHDFSPEAAEAFNAAHPDVEGVRYWSWSARSCGILEPRCREASDNELVDVLLGASYTLLLRFGENDGIVPTASMPWGEHLGMLFADHFDEVGQIADGSPDNDPFDHRAFYLSEARRLRDAGL